MFDRDSITTCYLCGKFGIKTYAGKSILGDIKKRYERNGNKRLLHKTAAEWEKRPSGLYLPHGKVLKRIEGVRIHRVTWKIVRGLFFYNEDTVLPENTPNRIEYIPPGERPPKEFIALSKEQNRGQYPSVFDYRYRRFLEIEGMYYWAMLLWDSFIILVAFHDPQCQCDTCSEIRLSVS